MAEKPGAPLADVLACMMQIHVNTHTCSTMRWKDYCVGTDTPPAISFTLPIMWWSAVATNILRMLQAKAALDNMTRSFGPQAGTRK
ncbi:putative short chain dehydrogenase [Escherichia coli]|uniref:Putative short chain dehydrogenase n=1 Tax=Escherichia coli TaxID=562 RepID=A0A376TG42_ECOLX|nr:putative short chain dehydrogenase [Escherichia coli]